MLRERKKAEPRDLISDLNRIAAAEVDRVALAKERKQWPLDLVGGHMSSLPRIGLSPDLRDAIIEAELFLIGEHLDEPLTGYDLQIEFSDDGYPKLPECLRRRRSGGSK